MGFEVSRGTAAKIRQLLARGQVTDGGTANGTGTGRHDIHVRVTADAGGGYWDCVPTSYHAIDEVWTEYDGPAVCLPSTDGDQLTVDRRYRAIMYGQQADGTFVFAVDAGGEKPEVDCHLEYDEDILSVTTGTLAGDGLEVADDSDSGTCDPLRVKAGCHVEVDAGGVHVTPDTLAGYGLTVQEDECDRLAVDPGCGVRIQGDGKVGLDLEAICTEAIKGLNDDGEGCSISLRYGCHLDLGPDPLDVGAEAVFVTPGTFAGQGLELQDESGCDKLKVKTGCGVRLDGNDAVGLDLEGICVEAIKGVNDDGAGCSISLRYGCHLDLQPDPLEEGAEAVYVTVSTMAGDGLEVEDLSGCDQLKVKAGCGIVVDTSGVSIDLASIAGTGLTVVPGEGEECPTLHATASAPELACGLEYITDEEDPNFGAIRVKASDLAGCGLEVGDGCTLDVDAVALAGCGLVAGGGCTIDVDPADLTGDGIVVSGIGCGLKVDVGCGVSIHPVSKKVQVELEDFDGDGLVVVTPEAGCKQLAVNPGCGLVIDGAGKVAVDLSGVAFDGLYWDNENCLMGVNVECGLQYVGDSGIGVDHAALAGDGLTVQEAGECDKLAVNPGCGVEIVAGQVAVKASDLAGAGLEVDTGCAIKISNPICFRYLDDISAECDGEGNITFTKTYKYFTGWGTVSDTACP